MAAHNDQELYRDDFFNTNLTKFAAIGVKKGPKVRFLAPDRKGGKERARRKKGREEKKAVTALLLATLRFGREKAVWWKSPVRGLLGANVFKNPTRCTVKLIHLGPVVRRPISA